MAAVAAEVLLVLRRLLLVLVPSWCSSVLLLKRTAGGHENQMSRSETSHRQHWEAHRRAMEVHV